MLDFFNAYGVNPTFNVCYLIPFPDGTDDEGKP